jgi:Mannosyltransferase putative
METCANLNDLVATPLCEDNAQRMSEQFIKQIPPYPGDRGIIIAAGGLRYFSNAWVCIKMLRHLGCKLPVQIWHLDEQEIDDYLQALVLPLGVECVNAKQVQKTWPARINGGWGLKPYAILHSPYREVLLLDADNVPIVNPNYLFDSIQFKEVGAIFWPDANRFGPRHPIWNICGVTYQDEPGFESGQIMVDKARCWQALCLTMWYNEHSDFYYKHIYGDKDTFHMAFRKLGQPYAMPATPYHPLTNTICQHDFGGRRIFQHRWSADWTVLFENKRINGFLYDNECRHFLQELRALLQGRWGHWRCQTGPKPLREKLVADKIVGRIFDYHPIGRRRRRMTFMDDGVIGIGCDHYEMFWDIKYENREIYLELCSENKVTCRMQEGRDGVWRGHWRQQATMPIELSPLESTISPGANSALARTVARRIIDRLFDYHRLSFDHCSMVFLENGTIGIGNTLNESFWNVKQENKRVYLEIFSTEGLTCRLEEGADQVWRGWWDRRGQGPVLWRGHKKQYERIAVELSPKANASGDTLLLSLLKSIGKSEVAVPIVEDYPS